MTKESSVSKQERQNTEISNILELAWETYQAALKFCSKVRTQEDYKSIGIPLKNDREKKRDLLIDALVDLRRKKSTLETEKQLKAWATEVAVNLCDNEYSRDPLTKKTMIKQFLQRNARSLNDYYPQQYKDLLLAPDLNQFKQDTINKLRELYPWRPRWFGHHHHNRLVAVCKAITNAYSPEEIEEILENQYQLAKEGNKKSSTTLLDSRWSDYKKVKNLFTKKSGYIKAIEAVLKDIDYKKTIK